MEIYHELEFANICPRRLLNLAGGFLSINA
jgi:hypothetical protein